MLCYIRSRSTQFTIQMLVFLSLIILPMEFDGLSAQTKSEAKTLRIGIIGLDTSHVPAFTKLINDPKAVGKLAEMEVVAAFPGGSQDIPSSRDRIEGYTKQLRDMNIEICDSIESMVTKVDAVLLESLDGRPHLKQALPVIRAGLPLFIDKPLGGDLADCIAIQKAAQEKNVRWFSSSSLRFSEAFRKHRLDPSWPANVIGAISWGACPIEKTHPDLFWYGIHGMEILYTAMGPGCVSVSRTYTEGAEVVTGTWKDGRIGTFRGIRDGKQEYGLAIFGKGGVEVGTKFDGYAPLVDQIASFFLGAEAPVANSETIELFAFMQAAQKSRELGGGVVLIEDIMRAATIEADARLAKLR